jgi:hypothetical protein
VNFSTIPDPNTLAAVVLAVAFGVIVVAFPDLGYLAVNGILLLVAIRYLRAER